MWQKCPICNGSGEVFPVGISNGPKECDLCKGKKIISKLTGKPPRDKNNKDTSLLNDAFIKVTESTIGEYNNIPTCSNCKYFVKLEDCPFPSLTDMPFKNKCLAHEWRLREFNIKESKGINIKNPKAFRGDKI